ncbi:Wzz/FepE/Etk N-terminal domain-containing protein [Massilia sp. B-10]|nr:Wzz/FepE/Etk N-terminal domain-containing protein [Massilia sp. B-10]
MNHPGEPHPLQNIQQNLPILSMPLQPRLSEYRSDAHDIDLKGYFNILYDSRWLIGGLTLLVTVMAVVYALIASPVYEANLMIHVEEESPNTSKNILSEVSSLFETKKAAIAEMELLRSRMVISHAVDNLQLYIDVRPKYFPVVGFWFADRQAAELSEPGVFGYGGYVWGPERADISIFDVPETWHNREFTITARGNGRYHLGGAGLPVIYEGMVGNTLKAETRG